MLGITETEQPNIEAKLPAKGRFAVNIATNILNFLVSIVIGIWYTPFLVHHLGIAAYGLIPLTTVVISYLGILTFAMDSAACRFLTTALEKDDSEYANIVFNTALFASAGLVALLLGPALWASAHTKLFFNVPAGYDLQFKWLFLCAVTTFSLSTLCSAFYMAAYCRNRFDLYNAIYISASIVRVGSVAVMFAVTRPQVWFVGVGLIVAAVWTFIGAVMVSRYLIPILCIRVRMFRWEMLKQQYGMGGWIVINQVGAIILLSIDVVLVNRIISAEAGGYYGALLPWPSMLRVFAGVIAGVFGPTMLALYARGQIKDLVRYSRQSVKLVGLVIALPVGLVAGLSKPLLSAWLGAKFVPLAPLMSLMTIHLCVSQGVLPLQGIQVATGKVRWPGIVTCVVAFAEIALAIFLAARVGWGMYGVAAAGAIVLTSRDVLFTPIYAARILDLPWWSFLRETVPIILSGVGLATVGWYISHTELIHGWLRIIGLGALLSAGYIALVYGLLLSPDERTTVRRMAGDVLVKR